MTGTLDEVMASLRATVDTTLEKYLAALPAQGRLLDAMRYSLMGPGKRLRPMLVLLAATACGGSVDAALPAACALEMIHTYSLIHDDLPAMDDDDLRRGRPTCHKQFDEATAILAGDGLLTLAFEVVARDVVPAQVAVACARELGHAAGAAGMVGGQMDDLLQERSAGGTLEVLEHIHRRKTGALFQAAVRMGALIALAHTDPESHRPWLAAFDEYAAGLGLAFQIADDLLDVEGHADQTGKRVGKDAGRGKLTYPGLLGPEGARQRLAAACRRADEALASFGPPTELLRQMVTRLAYRDR